MSELFNKYLYFTSNDLFQHLRFRDTTVILSFLMACFLFQVSHKLLSMEYDGSHAELNDVDRKTLDDGEWLNDAVVDYFNYSRVDEHADDGVRFHVLSSLMYIKLSDHCARPLYCNVPDCINRDMQLIDYKPVHSWYQDLLRNEFVLVPMRVGGNHWVLGVVCLPNESGTDTEVPERPEKPMPCRMSAILLFDSLKNDRLITTYSAKLRAYLNCVWHFCYKMGMNMPMREFTEENCPTIAVDIEQQTNMCDCGLYVIKATEVFMQRMADMRKFSLFDDAEKQEISGMFRKDIAIAGTNYRGTLREFINGQMK